MGPRSHPAGEQAVTLIELLIVLIITAILMAVAIPTYLNERDNARRTVTNKHMAMISDAAVSIRFETGKPMHELTGTFCSDCPCRSKALPRVGDPGFLASACGRSWDRVVNVFAMYFDSVDQARKVFTDGWGRPILLDENEEEHNWCLDPDQITSLGSAERMPSASGGKYGHAHTGKDDAMIVKDLPVFSGSCTTDRGFTIR